MQQPGKQASLLCYFLSVLEINISFKLHPCLIRVVTVFVSNLGKRVAWIFSWLPPTLLFSLHTILQMQDFPRKPNPLLIQTPWLCMHCFICTWQVNRDQGQWSAEVNVHNHRIEHLVKWSVFKNNTFLLLINQYSLFFIVFSIFFKVIITKLNCIWVFYFRFHRKDSAKAIIFIITYLWKEVWSFKSETHKNTCRE